MIDYDGNMQTISITLLFIITGQFLTMSSYGCSFAIDLSPNQFNSDGNGKHNIIAT